MHSYQAASGQRPRRRRGAALPGLMVSALILAGAIALDPTGNLRALQSLFGFGDDRLAPAVSFTHGDGSFAFALTQPGTDEPVGYDPCRPIQVAVNPDGAPAYYDELVETTMARTARATGLVFERVDDTDDRDFERMTWGGNRKPVLVAWATSDEVPQLAGNIAGIGGSVPVREGRGRLEYVTGVVVLDRAAFTDDADERPFLQATVDHEFGHLVGLGHVDDRGELMYERNIGQTSYGPGDLEGLARIGAIDC